jgi:protein serine kinase H
MKDMKQKGRIATNRSRKNIMYRYEFLREVGEGSSSKVFEARERLSNRRVAIKVTRGLNVSLEFMLQSQVEHSNILRVHEVCQQGKNWYIVMELGACDLLDVLSSRGRFRECDAARLMSEILRGVKALHDGGVTHRDLKLENLLVCEREDGSLGVKIGDFGLATSEESMDEVCGTLSYLSPQQVRGECYSRACDMWALGVLSYAMLTGVMPFDRVEGDERTMRAISEGFVIFPRESCEEVSVWGRDFVHSLLVENEGSRLTVDEALNHPWIRIHEE